MWIGVQHQQKQALELFSREVAPAGTGMGPGQTTLIGGRPIVYVLLVCNRSGSLLTFDLSSPILRLFSFAYPKDKIPVSWLGILCR